MQKHHLLTVPIDLSSFNALSVLLLSSCIVVQRRRYPLRTKVLPEGHRRIGFWPFDSNVNIYSASVFRSSFEYGVISSYSYCTSKDVSFMTHSDLGPQTIDLMLYVSLPSDILYQYVYVVPSDILNNYRMEVEGIWISMRNYEGTTKGFERKWREVKYIWRRNIPYPYNVNWFNSLRTSSTRY